MSKRNLQSPPYQLILGMLRKARGAPVSRAMLCERLAQISKSSDLQRLLMVYICHLRKAGHDIESEYFSGSYRLLARGEMAGRAP